MKTFGKLKGIASGLLGTFISRNNDIGGYWGIGVLRRDAPDPKATIQLDLTKVDGTPRTPVTVSSAEVYSRRLLAMLEQQRVPISTVADAAIVLEFGTSADFAAPPSLGNGDPFVCTVRLRDDRGVAYQVSDVGRVRPHDPNRETRSAR